MRVSILILCFLLGWSFSFGQNHCANDVYHQHLTEHQPERTQHLKDYNSNYHTYQSTLLNSKTTDSDDEIVYIPVVFHIVYRTSSQNISNNRIYEQIDILNNDFSATNSDTSTVPSVFKPFISDTKIRFILADTTPEGNSTTGITRHQTNTFDFSPTADDIKHASTDGVDSWDTDNYLNIWVGNLESGYLGYATIPIDAGTPDDGVVINYLNVGYNSSTNYDKGRTATHEIGHYLGLEHVWGPTQGCHVDDGIDDTPLQEYPHYGVPTHPMTTCGSVDMFMNYMDYGNDEVLVMFTEDQKNKMEYSLDILRDELWLPESVGLNKSKPLRLTIAPNPTSGNVTLSMSKPAKGYIHVIDIYGRLKHAQDVNYKEHVTLELSHLSKGIYFICFKSETSDQIIEKVIIE